MENIVRNIKRFQAEFEKHKAMLMDAQMLGRILDKAFDDPISYSKVQEELIRNNLEKLGNFVFHTVIIADIIHSNQKRKMLDSLPRQTKDGLFSAISVFTHISNRQVAEAIHDNEYQNVLSLVRKARRNKSNIDKLKEIYQTNKCTAIAEINRKIIELERKYYGERYDDIQAVINSNRADKAIILERIHRTHASKHSKKNFNFITWLKQDADSINSDELFKIESAIMAKMSDRMFTKRVALAIHTPTSLSYSYIFCDIKFSDVFLNCFCQNIPIPHVIDLFIEQKRGESLSNVFVDKYNRNDGLEDIVEIINSEYLSFPFSHILDNNKQALQEILTCHKKRLSYPTTCALLAAIEGILWSFAEFIDITSGKIFTYNNKGDIVSILNKIDNKPNANITIGTLLNTSCVGDILDKDFIAFFCNDLYSDRNEILHGRSFADASRVKTAEKMAVLKYILHEANKHIKKLWLNLYQENIPHRYIEFLTKQHKRITKP